MESNIDSFTITIRKHRWWAWLLAVGWLMCEALFLQTAVASMREDEVRAAIACWSAFGAMLALACIALQLEKRHRKNASVRLDAESAPRTDPAE